MSETKSLTNEKRHIQRISMTLLCKVEVQLDKEVKWDEITSLIDVSTYGASFRLSRPVKRGRLVALTMPMPRRLRIYDYAEPQYKIWGLVRHCIKGNSPYKKGEIYSVGVAFVGKNSPKDFADNPAQLYDISHLKDDGFWFITVSNTSFSDDIPPEHRRQSRFKIPINITIELLDNDGNTIKTEETVTENISLTGASIFSTLDLEIGSFIRIRSEQYDAAIISIVRDKRTGEDKIPRLHIEFVDRFFPLEGIESNLN